MAPPPPPAGAHRPHPRRAGTVSGSWAAPQVAPPVYQPPPSKAKRRGGFKRFLLVLVVLLIVLLLIVGAFLVLTGGGPFGSSSPLTVSAVSVTVGPTTGKCPSSKYVFTGRITTNGSAGGPITYQWVKPDGSTIDGTVDAQKGEAETVATLEFTYQGNGNAAGDAVLRVIKPTNLASQPTHITYTCP